jgi:hypothetical protein
VPANPGKGGDVLLDNSIARFQMTVGEKTLTAYQADSGEKNLHLSIPVYYLVEWLALNWWSFLYEPRKLDREEAEQDFRSRHWLGNARNGFALPDAMFSPSGDKIEIISRPAYLRFAQLNFYEAVTASVSTDEVRSAFISLIEEVLKRLSEHGVTKSTAHEAWDRVTKTTKEEETYCRLIGSMGLSPYIAHPEIDAAMDRIAAKISESMLSDLCDATNLGTFNRAVDLTGAIAKAFAKAKTRHINKLLAAQKPADTLARAYEWGYHATDAAREAFGIAHDDPSGATAFLERLQIDPSAGSEPGADANAFSVISGAITREGDDAQLSLAGSNSARRKFAAVRASFLTWSDSKQSSRLVTTARTRDQQASRAFAAELLAPAKFLKKRLGERGEVSPFTLDKISDEIGVAPNVVHYQAKNHGYYIAEAA